MAVKDFDPDDPMEMVGVAIPDGDEVETIDGLITEYLMMGWTRTQIGFLFASPYFMGTNQMLLRKGKEYITNRIDHLATEFNKGWIG